jgi:lipoprotein-anchoring transpeptidase ErfK/SrfK
MQLRYCVAVTFALATTLATADLTHADVLIKVDKAAQRLTVTVDGVERYQWQVSTARPGYTTPNGIYRPVRLEQRWFSRKYDDVPMPYSIFFHGGYAIHGSYEISRIGKPASHGCVRLNPKNAEVLFKLVKDAGNKCSQRCGSALFL